ncbi:MAG: DUF4147 domain-containing protein, partial [Anaerolineae bacterium]|nr:DUF4147 domain-containing protein [Anaerolineae bacterium]
MQRITNADSLTSYGNIAGRKDLVEILEAGLQATDPYDPVTQLIHVQDGRLIIHNPAFEPRGAPVSGPEIYDLKKIRHIYVIGAGKGVQRAAKALEDILGDWLTGGHIIDKKGTAVILDRIDVTLGGHPVPDEDGVQGCRQILALTRDLTEDDLVFTLAASGFSSLLTLPVPGINLEDIQNTVRILQIERGMPTDALSPIRNHLDKLKGGRISAYIHPARMIHLLAKDPATYDTWIHHNYWVHTFPDHSTFNDAVRILHAWDAWDAVPKSVQEILLKADPAYETVKPETYQKFTYRIYGLLPGEQGLWPSAQKKAAELGYSPVTLALRLDTEACYAGQFVATVARTIEQEGKPFKPPVALFTAGELLVKVGEEKGIGGRNQEYVLSAALKISGSKHIVIGAVDT